MSSVYQFEPTNFNETTLPNSKCSERNIKIIMPSYLICIEPSPTWQRQSGKWIFVKSFMESENIKYLERQKATTLRNAWRDKLYSEQETSWCLPRKNIKYKRTKKFSPEITYRQTDFLKRFREWRDHHDSMLFLIINSFDFTFRMINFSN